MQSIKGEPLLQCLKIIIFIFKRGVYFLSLKNIGKATALDAFVGASPQQPIIKFPNNLFWQFDKNF